MSTPAQPSLESAIATPRPWRRWVGALAFVGAALLGGCGGGGGDSVGTGGTGAFAVGTVTGFGSVFVNGVRYDDSAASVVDDFGDDSGVKVGMVVEVSGRVDDSGTTRTADRIVHAVEIKGPVTAVDAVAGTFKVFDITVRTTAGTTVYDKVSGVEALAAGNVVEVYGYPDTQGSVRATLVELEAPTVAAFIADDGEYRLRGQVQGLSGTAPAQAFTVRGVAIRTDASTDVEGVLAEDAPVSVKFGPVAAGDGSYLAEKVKVRTFDYHGDGDAGEAEVEGYVSGFTSVASTFQVAGYAVRLGSNVVYEDGGAADLKDGVRVEVKGTVEGGVLVATKLEFKSRDDDGDGEDDDVSSSGSQEFEFKGTATCIVCGATEGTFTITIKAVNVRYDAQTRFEDGLTGATLNGRALEVKSVAESTANGTVYRATEIKLDD